jgi:hypothetical protein
MDYDRRDKTAARHDGDPIWEIHSGVNIALDQARRLSSVDMTGWSPRVRTTLQKALEGLHHVDKLLETAAKELDRA